MVIVYGECWVNVVVKGCQIKKKLFCHVTLQIIMCDNIQICIRLFENKTKLELLVFDFNAPIKCEVAYSESNKRSQLNCTCN